MATQEIFENHIRTQLGRVNILITDTETDTNTPNKHNGGILGGIDLQYGDTGQTTDELNFGALGSFFDLSFVDNKSKEFQTLFNLSFDKKRFLVEVTFPSPTNMVKWQGFVQPEITPRSTSKRTGEDIVNITVSDNLGFLKDESRLVNTAIDTIDETLVNIFNLCNRNLDIYYYADLRGNDPTTSDSPIGFKRMAPVEVDDSDFAPFSKTYKGLEGQTVREQLDNLCKTFHAIVWQDPVKEGYVFQDLATVGKSLSGGHVYERSSSSWNSWSPNDRSVIVESVREDEGALEKLPSAKKVCTSTPNWSVDPKAEQFSLSGETDTLYYWEHPDSEVRFSSSDEHESEIYVEANTGESIENSGFFGVDIEFIDTVRFKIISDSRVAYSMVLEYGDGTTETFDRLGSEPDEAFVDVDKNKNELYAYNLGIADGAGVAVNVYEIEVELLEKETVTQPDGSTDTKYFSVDTLCFEDDGVGRKIIETPVYSFTIYESANLSRIASDGNFSRRYANIVSPPRWRAKNLLALLKPGIESLKTTVDNRWLPPGDRIRYQKPNASSRTSFVPITGRKLLVHSEQDLATEINEVEISTEVENAIDNI